MLGFLTGLAGLGKGLQTVKGIGGLLGMVGSGLSARPLQHNFDYTASTGGMSALAGKLQNQGDQFFDPNSDFYSRQRGRLAEQIGQGVAQDTLAQNRMLASRGVGSGGIRTMLDMVNTSGIGEEARQGQEAMYSQGLGVGSNMYGQAGQLQSNIASLQDQQKQFTLTNQYNQKLANRQRSGDFFNQLTGIFNPFDSK